MTDSDLSRFEYLWTQPGWVVSKSSEGGYLPVNLGGYAMLIEDDDLCARVCEQMIATGRPVLTELPEFGPVTVTKLPELEQ